MPVFSMHRISYVPLVWIIIYIKWSVLYNSV